MDYAIIKTSGKQYKVSPGDIIDIDQINLKPKDAIVFSDVLLLVSDKNVQLGKPMVKNAKVNGVVLEHVKGEKVRVAKFKAKVRYRKVTGQRPKFTRVKVEKISKS